MRRSCAPAFFGVRPLSGVGRRAAVVALGALAISFGTTAPASADSCTRELRDALGFRWDVTTGSLGPGWVPAGTTTPESAGGFISDGSVDLSVDAYDGFGALRIGATGVGNGTLYEPGDPNGCTVEDGGREISFPEMPVDLALLQQVRVTRKVYVPASGGFVRFLDIVRNVSLTPVPTTVSYEGVVGSFGDTRVLATASGARPNRWMTSANCDPAVDPAPPNCDGVDPIPGPPLAHIFDGPGSPPTPATGVYGGGSSMTSWADPSQAGEPRVRAVYNLVVIPPGDGQPGGADTFVFMHLDAQRSTRAGTLAAAQALGDVTIPDAFSGLSDTELADLRNWNPNDLDGDNAEVLSGSDNCRFVANVNQANLDGDSFGDACDDDIDGDGLSNGTEAALGTNPNVVDTDADGFRDAADGCPLQPGPANGCPPPAQAARDTTPPSLRIVVPQSLKRKSFVRGLTAIVTLNEAASLNFELIGPAGRTRARRSLGRTLTSQSLPVSGAGTRAVRLRPSPRLLGRARRFTASLRVTAVDRSGNKTVETRTIRVR